MAIGIILGIITLTGAIGLFLARIAYVVKTYPNKKGEVDYMPFCHIQYYAPR